MGPMYCLILLTLMLCFRRLSHGSLEIIPATCDLMMFLVRLEPGHCKEAAEPSLNLSSNIHQIWVLEAALIAWNSWAWLRSWGRNQHSVSWSSLGDEIEDREAKFHSKSWINKVSIFSERGVFSNYSLSHFPPFLPPLPLITISWQHE